MNLRGVDADEFAALDALLTQALDLAPDQREAWLRSQCGEDLQRWTQLSALLRRAAQPAAWERALESEPVRHLFADALDKAMEPELPKACGDWRLIRSIGRGGMADIYLARADTSLGGSRLCVVKQILA